MMPAAWWRPLSDEKVACELCPMGCTLAPGTTGPCGTRMNDEGQMRPLHYGELVSAGLDPIEKKPLYHFHPGRKILSVAAPGCNLHCRFCQNHTISQNTGLVTTSAAPKEVVQEALEAGSVGLAFTYSEPLVWFEFVRDTARLARAAGLKNVLVTNGFLNSEPLAELLPFIDAANVDLKAMDEDFYRRICGGSLQPVLRSIESFHAAGVHLELTNLLIPGHNDTDEHGDRLIAYIEQLDPAIPLHLTGYFPAWKMDAPPTPRATLERAFNRASARLPWVYLGNSPSEFGRDTWCPGCGERVVRRSGFRAVVKLKKDGRCHRCDHPLPIVCGALPTRESPSSRPHGRPSPRW
ncbi:AmmeMemoRadiSam system radical SAM enzyme [bacterium DOLZORAL124_64_63]|nr:MAG: AmmeMemoRadiSam system radical SAM enzyme [bacterium DOLZORAL124_64_63]